MKVRGARRLHGSSPGAAWLTGPTAKRNAILYVTPGYRLICLDAKTGGLVKSFGKDGVVDLKLDDDQTIALIDGEIGLQSAPVVAKDTIIIGAAFREGMTPKSMHNNKGFVRGFDVRTGKRLWIFHTIPMKGEPGYETWEKGSAEYTGNTGVWTQVTVDEQLGLVYLPVESPTGDYYGGHRPGNNLYGESLVCVDLKTGQRKWLYQLVHHPLWDMDISSAPILADINVDGRTIKAVAQPTKQGILYVFDRVTGKPVWPIEERPVEKGDVEGEWYAPTQPFPTKPPPYSRNGVTPDILVDFTPAIHDQAMTIAAKYKLGPVFTPPTASKASGLLATLTLGHGGRRQQLVGRFLRSGDAHGLRLREQCQSDAHRLGARAEGCVRHELYFGNRRPGNPHRPWTGRKRGCGCSASAAHCCSTAGACESAERARPAAGEAALRNSIGDQSR